MLLEPKVRMPLTQLKVERRWQVNFKFKEAIFISQNMMAERPPAAANVTGL